MVLAALTAEERERHERAVARMRARRFRRRAPAEFFILDGSERIISASAESRWNAACGDYRLFRLGGLAYTLDLGDGRRPGEVSICHTGQDRFDFWVTGGEGHTVHSSSIRFDMLDTRVCDVVLSYRRSLLTPVFTMKRRTAEAPEKN